MRIEKDARCTGGLRNPAHLQDRWPSLRKCLRPICSAILEARARSPDCVGLTTTCGEHAYRPPPSEEGVASVRATISSTMRLTVECHHASSTLRFDMFYVLARLTGDLDVHVANWLEEGPSMGIQNEVVPGGHFPLRASVRMHWMRWILVEITPRSCAPGKMFWSHRLWKS